MSNRRSGSSGWRRVALLLLACALLLKVPAGWMPEASARGVTIGWCNGVDPAAMAEGKALLERALADRSTPKHETSGDQPCPFAAAAQPIATSDALPVLAPIAAPVPVFVPVLAAIPGRGLAAPPPFATGPPLLA
ncbi:MAG: hypothetical protein EOP60_13345 [Sphingomonadales bacterium]|nr:MAG: hypothetical protein EOP60_13345 [Sphingomonadales bacterium]